MRTSAAYRQLHNQALLVGSDLLEEVQDLTNIEVLFYVQESSEIPGSKLGKAADRCIALAETAMLKVTNLRSISPNSMAGIVNAPNKSQKKLNMDRILVLDGVQDPGNVGSLLRTAVACGWDAAYLLPGCCDPLNDKCLKSSRGASFKLLVQSLNIDEWRRSVQEHDLICLGAVPRTPGTPIHSENRSSKKGNGIYLVLGSEGSGLSPRVAELCHPIAIPMSGMMESLNVAVAGGILLFSLSKGAEHLRRDLEIFI